MFTTMRIRSGLCTTIVLGLLPLLAAGQIVQDTQPPSASGDEIVASKALRESHVGAVIRQPNLIDTLTPQIDAATLAWIAALVVLVLVFQARRFLSLRNLDVLLIATLCLLLLYRNNLGLIPGTAHTAQWWAYALLTAICGYWVLRGFNLMATRQSPAAVTNLSEGALTIVVLAGLVFCCVRIVSAPVSDGSRDGLLGGICMADTGHLPYGDVDGAARSPLLYLAHAGVVELMPPDLEYTDRPATATWADRKSWLKDHWEDTIDPTTIRIVNGALFLLIFMGVAGIGHRMHSVAMGQTLCAILCFFPGTYAALNQPEVLLPAALVTWSVACLRVPVVGSLLSLACAVFAGFAWPWAWLMLPVLLGFSFARGWHAFGGLLGLLGAGVAAVIGITVWTAPTLPRADGALAAAAMQPEFTATRADDGALVIDRYGRDDKLESTIKSWLWRYLAQRENVSLQDVGLRAAVPTGVDGSQILLRRIAADGNARPALQKAYRDYLAEAPNLVRGWTATRTLMEATWLAEPPSHTTHKGAWELWAGSGSIGDNTWMWIRRSGKIATGLFALFAMIVLARRKAVQQRHAVGALLVVAALSLALSESGAVIGHLIVLPIILAALAAHDPTTPAAAPQTSRAPGPASAAPPPPPGAAPRITIER